MFAHGTPNASDETVTNGAKIVAYSPSLGPNSNADDMALELPTSSGADNPVEYFRLQGGTGYLGLSTDNPKYALDLNFTDGMRMPVGTTAERPLGLFGVMRANTTTEKYEVGFLDSVYQSIVTENTLFPTYSTATEPTASTGRAYFNTDDNVVKVSDDGVSYKDLAYDEDEAEASFLALSSTNTLTQGASYSHVDGFFGSALTDFSATSDSTLEYTGTETKKFLLSWGANLTIAETGGAGASTFDVQIAPHKGTNTLSNGLSRVQVVIDNDTVIQPVGRTTIVTLSTNDVISLKNIATVDANVAYSISEYNIYLTEL